MPLRLLIASDLHLEFHPDGGRALLASLDLRAADAVAVTGDLCNAATLLGSLTLLCQACPLPVLFVPGNHEYYGSSFDAVNAQLQAAQAALPNLTLLNNRVLTLAGRRIVGTPLWFPDGPDHAAYEGRVNDFRVIQGFKPAVYAAHAEARRFLEAELQPGDIVLTHHLPSPRSVSPRFAGDPVNRFFVSPMDALIEQRQPALWAHGHTHDSADYTLGRTRIVCNPFGYVGRELNPAWDPAKVVEL
jgi:Icc-related predicted phosphoesterase